MKHHLVLLGAAVFGITACGTASDRGAGPTVIAPVPIRTCTPRQELERVVIPAKTEKFYAITEIANPPYEPITRREERTRIVEEERVYYENAAGEEITDICEEQVEGDADMAEPAN